MRKLRKFNDVLRESLKNPLEAKAYLDVALENYEEDGDAEAYKTALKDVHEVHKHILGDADKWILAMSTCAKLRKENV